MKENFDLYLNYLKNELYFCKTAINQIDISSSNPNIEAKDFFYHASVLFNSLANISKILNNNSTIETSTRSQKIKELLKIKDNKIEILNNRQYRNSNEHYDERIDLLLKNKKRTCCHIDLSVFNFISISDFDNFGRIFLISERTFYFINSKNNTEKICLEEIEKVINYLEKAIKCIE